ncbi:MAG TPA: adenylate/guanylate cyclase domain-containing protein [Candidatus Binatia bacterium]|nr:adenylate/guanylate cyclase domain-containing protein [Candidatus Binatia bacterium]
MTNLPSGTVTFLFSDIEGSTRLAQLLEARWTEVLSQHRSLLRNAFSAHGGIEVSTEGDSFFVAFPTAAGAIGAAVAGQRALAGHDWPAGTDLRVRIGVHTAEGAMAVEDDYAGIDVHRAARIMGAGHGGQVLLSAVTRALVEQSLPPDVSLLDLGRHRLKDLAQPEDLTQLCVRGLPTEFPPLRTLDIGRTNLPAQATTFIGRDEEVARIRELLRENRLVTLTGPGGTGKTRLSLQVAAEELEAFADGVFFVALESVREPELVVPSVGKAIGVADVGPSPIQRLIEHLAGKRLLLVLDNLEQVVEVAPAIGALLQGAAGLSILATSRSALHVYGEQEYAVPPLPMPDPREVIADRSIVRYAAVALFVERARRVKPDFEVTDENAQAVVEVCWRLDGLPLAIELAAARIRILTPQAMVARLSRRLDLGTGGSRDLPERQQTLREAIAWSYDLLDEDEQRFFSAFSVFSGGADLEAAEAVLAAHCADVVEAVGALVDQSLLRQEELADGTPRFVMLETIREYAEEQLGQRPVDAAALRRAHAMHFLARAEATAAGIFSDDQKRVLDRAERDHDNLRAALSWATTQGESVLAMRMLAASWRLWQMRGYLAEGEDRATRVLDMPGLDEHRAEQAAALEAAGGLAYWRGDIELARERYDRALAIQREIGDDAAIANALFNLSMSFTIGEDAVPMRIPPEIPGMAQEAVGIYRRIGDRRGEGRALWALLGMEVLQLNADAAARLGEECLRIFTGSEDRFMLAWTEYMLGLNDTLRGERVAGRERYLRALESFRASGDFSGYALVLDGLAALAYDKGERAHAMLVAGGADAIQRQGGAHLARRNREWAGFYPERLLSDPELAAAWEAGRAMKLDDLLDLAASGTGTPQDGAARSRRGKTTSA